MSEARKIMNVAENINITEEDKKVAMAAFLSAPSMSVDEAIKQYKFVLDEYCVKFEALNYCELMTRADELEFDPTICFEILDKYSFIERHQS